VRRSSADRFGGGLFEGFGSGVEAVVFDGEAYGRVFGDFARDEGEASFELALEEAFERACAEDRIVDSLGGGSQRLKPTDHTHTAKLRLHAEAQHQA